MPARRHLVGEPAQSVEPIGPVPIQTGHPAQEGASRSGEVRVILARRVGRLGPARLLSLVLLFEFTAI